ncbi:MAG: endonuclease/exonuclease/phosphatase family protein [Akkermansiaceae bacterium]|nr:endonuclease/exonuclease/phosphatase family protein [Armatimonadota bacterium]
MAMNIATFNIRYDNPKDGVNAWPNRKDWVRDLIDYHAFDIVGVQEALASQVDFLADGRFDYVGVGREDGKRAGEFAALFYDRKRFTRRESGTFWLSETPDVPSKGWDADLNRVCSWTQLADKGIGDRDFFVFNTHFDHKGVVARERSAELILAKIKDIVSAKPFFLMGDLNLTPDTVPVRKLAAALRNSRAVTEAKPYGPSGTFNGFDITRPLEQPIDYIFVSPGVRVLKYAVLPDNWGARYPSDHLPVLIRADLTGT